MITAVDPASAARIAYCTQVRAHFSRIRGRPSDYGSLPIPRWDGGEDSDGKRYRAIWPRIAEFAATNHLDLGRLFRSVFNARQGKGHPPTPDQCIGAHVLEIYRQYQAENWSKDVVAEEQSLARQKLQFASGIVSNRPMRELLGWSDTQVLRSVLADPHRTMSALFRFCSARLSSADDIAEVFEAGAVQQYLLQPELYQAAWGNFIPPGFPGILTQQSDVQETRSCRPRQDRKGRPSARDCRFQS